MTSQYTYWQCIKRQYKKTNNCKASLKIENYEQGERNMIVVRTAGHDENHSHNHGPDYAHQIKKDINEELKRLAVNCINLKTVKLVDRVIKEIEHVKLINFVRGDVIIQKARHFIYFTDEQLVYMAKAHKWYIDGTFKIVKKPIKQLVTIHVVLVYLGSKRFSIPVCFILMTHRRKGDYMEVLNVIKNHCNKYIDEHKLHNKLIRITADFEIPLWQAKRELRSQSNSNFLEYLQIKGCYFYITQAIFRKVIQNKLQPEYSHKNNSGLRIYIKWLMTLVLLPPNVIEPTFEQIYDKIIILDCQDLNNLFEDFKKTWLTNNNWTVNEICLWGLRIRTNDDSERFHIRLMNSINKGNTEFYELINILGDIGNNIYESSEIFAQGMIESKQKRKQVSFEELLTNASNDLYDKKINAIEFLNQLTTINHDNQLVNHDWGVNNSRIDTLPVEESDTENDENANKSD